MKYKTKPFKHQKKALSLSRLREWFAYLMEQGTGKSWTLINDAAELRREGLIDLILIFAPKGVAPGWIYQQLPTHMPDDVEFVSAQWKPKSRATSSSKRALNDVLKQKDKLRVIVMNIEAMGMTDEAVDFAIEVLDSCLCALVAVDESHRIKSPEASVTKRILKHVKPRAGYRRILTGTVADKPFDLFSQFGFLSSAILGTDSFSAFKAEYAEMLPESSGLMRHIVKRVPKKWSGLYINGDTGEPAQGSKNNDGSPRQKQMVPVYIPQIPKTDANGRPVYKNLDKLHDLIAPHSYRVLKRDCLDLPPKLYSRHYTELSDQQLKLYDQIKNEHRVQWEDGRLSVFAKLTVYLRLQQVICGYIPTGEEKGKLHEIFPKWSANNRIVSCLELMADRPESEGTIIWCRFVTDILRLTEALSESYGARSVVQFYGNTSDKDRIENVQRFEGTRIIMNKSGKVIAEEPVPDEDRPRFMIAQQQSGGVGQTWVAANHAHYYSNNFSLIDRLQSEDRPHRIGQKHNVNYTDMEAEGTIDTTIIDALVGKKEVADVINGDECKAWI